MNFDYEDYYKQLLKNALKYGMSSNEFWYGETYTDYFLYEEAYYERLHEEKHIQGYYNFIAFNVILSNAFIDKKKGNKPLSYPDMNIYQESKKKLKIDKNNGFKKEKITKENLQSVYMNRLANCY